MNPQLMNKAIGLGTCTGCRLITFVADLTPLRRADDPPETKLCGKCLEARHVDRERRAESRPSSCSASLAVPTSFSEHTSSAIETILRASQR